MGNVASEACSCGCDDGFAARYGEVFGGGPTGLPPEHLWQEEECKFEKTGYTPQAGRTFGARRREVSPLDCIDASLQQHFPESPSSCTSPVNQLRRHSWQDLDADGHYHLHFVFRQRERFGLQLIETSDPLPRGLLVVAQVEASGAFSCTSNNSPGLFAGDVILMVNRIRGTPAAMRDIVNQVATDGGELFVVVQSRPAAFDVSLKREGQNWKKLGLSVAIDRLDSIRRMRVRAVRNEGLVPLWNERHGNMRICAGDWITQVNGKIKSAEDMYAMIQAATEGEELELRIETPERDAPRQDLDMLSPKSSPRGARRNPDTGGT